MYKRQGEDKDYEDTEGSYLLTKREKENLRVVTKYFNEVAVLLNVSNIIDMSLSLIHILNGHRTSENRELLEDILRGEWNYQGMVTTDWWTSGEHCLLYTSRCV